MPMPLPMPARENPLSAARATGPSRRQVLSAAGAAAALSAAPYPLNAAPKGPDVTAGYNPEDDFPLQQRPTDPDMREGLSMWISDDKGRFGLPRFTVEAIGHRWEDRGVEANIAFPDGRVLYGGGAYPRPAPLVREGRIVSVDAGPLRYELVEPLKHWRMHFDGPAADTTLARELTGDFSGPAKHVRISLDAIMAIPPWTPGEKAARGGDATTAVAVGAVGGHRHEQLFRCSGRFAIEGEAPLDFTGTGLFVNRRGVRKMQGFPGHVWASALFPSGKGFGVLAFPPRGDGTPAYNEAFVYENGRKTYASVAEAPWMTRFDPIGPLNLVLATDDGRTVRIDGRGHDNIYNPVGTQGHGNWHDDNEKFNVMLPFHRGGVRYTWDGEGTYGMIERSYPPAKMTA